MYDVYNVYYITINMHNIINVALCFILYYNL